jgi:hypothetical protein
MDLLRESVQLCEVAKERPENEQLADIYVRCNKPQMCQKQPEKRWSEMISILLKPKQILLIGWIRPIDCFWRHTDPKPLLRDSTEMRCTYK